MLDKTTLKCALLHGGAGACLRRALPLERPLRGEGEDGHAAEHGQTRNKSRVILACSGLTLLEQLDAFGP